jgi:hypothetical protein
MMLSVIIRSLLKEASAGLFRSLANDSHSNRRSIRNAHECRFVGLKQQFLSKHCVWVRYVLNRMDAKAVDAFAFLEFDHVPRPPPLDSIPLSRRRNDVEVLAPLILPPLSLIEMFAQEFFRQLFGGYADLLFFRLAFAVLFLSPPLLGNLLWRRRWRLIPLIATNRTSAFLVPLNPYRRRIRCGRGTA